MHRCRAHQICNKSLLSGWPMPFLTGWTGFGDAPLQHCRQLAAHRPMPSIRQATWLGGTTPRPTARSPWSRPMRALHLSWFLAGVCRRFADRLGETGFQGSRTMAPCTWPSRRACTAALASRNGQICTWVCSDIPATVRKKASPSARVRLATDRSTRSPQSRP